MRSIGSVEHDGVVVDVTDRKIRVDFIAKSACSGCHAKGACALSDVESKFVEVNNEGTLLEVGNTVKIILQQKQGFRALWIGYVLPLFLMVTTLIIVLSISGREGLAGISGVLILIPYYLALYFRKDKIREKFEFILKKTE